MSSINYIESRFINEFEYIFKIMHEHADDVWTENNPTKIELDVHSIMNLEDLDQMVSIVAEEDGKRIGVISGYICNHVHHRSEVFATTHLLYANKDLGKKRIRVIKGLIAAFEALVRKKYNAGYCQIGLSARKDIRGLVEKLGYTHTDYILSRRLK